MTKLSKRQFMASAGALGLLAHMPRARAQSPRNQAYDAIVVGGGSAGAVIGARLSADPNRRVLVLEAGPRTSNPTVDDPKSWVRLFGSDLVFQSMTTPQTHLENRELFTVHGKVLGGSSTINAMIHHRPVPADVDTWGLDQWRWEAIEPMLRKSERFSDPTVSGRGSDGPIGVLDLPDPPPLVDAVFESAEQLGLGVSPDINGQRQMGAALNQLAFADEKRQHTGHAYLDPVWERPNLTVLTEAPVQSLMMDKQSCVGVTYVHNGETHMAEAGRVVLSAGALRTPQLLMLSGIGPGAHLQEHGIKVTLDSPEVGLNLHDHLLISGNSFATPEPVQASNYHGTCAVVYASTGQYGGERDVLFNVSTNASSIPPLKSAPNGFKTSFSYMKPRSRGRLSLASRDPAQAPVIAHAYLADERDVDGALSALALSREMLSSKAFASLGGEELNSELFKSRDSSKSFLARGATPFGHHCGTCRMGTEATAPVSPSLALNGITNLDVMDASVIPDIPSAPTNATVVAMAELYASRFAG